MSSPQEKFKKIVRIASKKHSNTDIIPCVDEFGKEESKTEDKDSEDEVDDKEFLQVHPISSSIEKISKADPPETESLSDHGSNAIDILNLLHKKCLESGSKSATIQLQEVTDLIKSFKLANDPKMSKFTLNAEENLKNRFESHAHIFDDRVQNFITENYARKLDVSEAFKTALRRTSLMRQCIGAFGSAKKQASTVNCDGKNLRRRRTLDSLLSPLVFQEESIRCINNQLSKLSTWDFNIFELSKHAQNQILPIIGCAIIDSHRLSQHYTMNTTTLISFFSSIQEKYLPNSYHNVDHAADVAQSLHFFLSLGGMGTFFNQRSKLAAILAAIIHDVGHTGFNNNYHNECNDEIAVCYSYRSPLEHMHCAIAFRTMKEPGKNILEPLSNVQQMEVKSIMIDMVLATDNSVHGMFLGQFEAKIRSSESDGGLTLTESDDQRLVLQIALHAADVSNPAKPFSIYRNWTERIMEEFYLQGDKERERDPENANVSVGCDRFNPIPEAKMQAGFIIGVVRPVYKALGKLPKVSIGRCLQFLQSNLDHYQNMIEQQQAKKQLRPLSQIFVGSSS